MMPTQFTCPQCQKVLRLASAVSPGSMVKCPQCAKVFAVNAQDSAAPPKPATAAPAPMTNDPKPTAQIPATAPLPQPPAPAVASRPATPDFQQTDAAVADTSTGSKTSPKYVQVLSKVGKVLGHGASVGGKHAWKGMKWSSRKGVEVGTPVYLKAKERILADKRLFWGATAFAGMMLLGLIYLGYSWFGTKAEIQVVSNEVHKPARAKDIAKKKRIRPAGSVSGKLDPEVLSKVKKSTVYIFVETAEGKGSGSGFFGIEPGIVLTNAHVVGMLDPEAEHPRKIEVRLNSNQKDERTIPAVVLDVDRKSDLAVLRLSGSEIGDLPEPLTVISASELHETDQAFVVGFPFGNLLGKDITINPTSISSLRKNDRGELTQIQVNGGMDHGNSGGPVIDSDGDVVGVAVSIIQGTQLNFAIPGDSVHNILNGRIKDMIVGTAYRKNGMISIPLEIHTIDPLKRMKKVGVDWWVGNPGADREPTANQQSRVSGDGERHAFYLTYNGDTARGELLLPSESIGSDKVYWIQPLSDDKNDETHWIAGRVLQFDAPVDTEAATLILKHQTSENQASLKTVSTFEFRSESSVDRSVVSSIECKLNESTRSVNPQGIAQRQVRIDNITSGYLVDNRKADEHRLAPALKHSSKLLINLSVDGKNNIVSNNFTIAGGVPADAVGGFQLMAQQISQSLDSLTVPVPNENLSPGRTWKGNRSMPLDVNEKLVIGTLDMTYTFRGTRTRNGRKEAVIGLAGAMRLARGGAMNGKISGSAVFDMETQNIVSVKSVVDIHLNVMTVTGPFKMTGKIESEYERLLKK